MKTTLYLLIAVLTFSFSSFAQIDLHYNGTNAPETLSIDSADVNSMADSDYFKKDLYVVNNSNNDYQLEFKRLRRYHKNNWTDQVCDNLICFNASDSYTWVRPTDAGNAITLSPGDSSLFQPKVFPHLTAGCSIYTYQITNSFGVVLDTIQITYTLGAMNCFLGIEDEATEDISYTVYPNPVNDVLNITIEQTAVNTSISIINIVGKEVAQMPLVNGNNQLDVSTLSSGVYFYSLKTNNKVVETKKLIVR